MKACYDIMGMNCAACSAAVERAVRNAGIEDAAVNLLSGVLTIDYDENIIFDPRVDEFNEHTLLNTKGYEWIAFRYTE